MKLVDPDVLYDDKYWEDEPPPPTDFSARGRNRRNVQWWLQDGREDYLREAYTTGVRLRVIIKHLGRSKNAVIGKANRMGLRR